MTMVNFTPETLTGWGTAGQRDIALMCEAVKYNDPTLNIEYDYTQKWFIITGTDNPFHSIERINRIFSSRKYFAWQPKAFEKNNNSITVKMTPLKIEEWMLDELGEKPLFKKKPQNFLWDTLNSMRQ